ncbi:MAG TPA: polysaccharide deacetylase family protein [Terriglobales bacterium]|nr:polysaccharide deacetylase family protein [Terriglobales bacterium]
MPKREYSLARLLGYDDEARLLIVNADDFGMCHAENVATIDGLCSGAFSSSTLMVPCPWFDHAAAFVVANPQIDAGVHITHTSEWDTYRWSAVSPAAEVSSLMDASGKLVRDVATFYAQARIDEVERETRAQIDKALAAGIDVTHLDSHMGTLQLDPAYHALYVRIAAEYRLPIRMASRSMLARMGMAEVVDLADSRAVLAPDHFWIGGPAAPEETAAYWTQVLRELQPGVTEIYLHAAIDTPEMRAITDSWDQRRADYQWFLSDSAGALLDELGVLRIGYRPIRALQRSLRAC